MCSKCGFSRIEAALAHKIRTQRPSNLLILHGLAECRGLRNVRLGGPTRPSQAAHKALTRTHAPIDLAAPCGPRLISPSGARASSFGSSGGQECLRTLWQAPRRCSGRRYARPPTQSRVLKENSSEQHRNTKKTTSFLYPTGTEPEGPPRGSWRTRLPFPAIGQPPSGPLRPFRRPPRTADSIGSWPPTSPRSRPSTTLYPPSKKPKNSLCNPLKTKGQKMPQLQRLRFQPRQSPPRPWRSPKPSQRLQRHSVGFVQPPVPGIPSPAGSFCALPALPRSVPPICGRPLPPPLPASLTGCTRKAPTRT